MHGTRDLITIKYSNLDQKLSGFGSYHKCLVIHASTLGFDWYASPDASWCLPESG